MCRLTVIQANVRLFVCFPDINSVNWCWHTRGLVSYRKENFDFDPTPSESHFNKESKTFAWTQSPASQTCSFDSSWESYCKTNPL